MKAAVDFGHRALVAWLLERGADVNARAGGETDETGLHSAAWNGDLAMVELLSGPAPTCTSATASTTPRRSAGPRELD